MKPQYTNSNANDGDGNGGNGNGGYGNGGNGSGGDWNGGNGYGSNGNGGNGSGGNGNGFLGGGERTTKMYYPSRYRYYYESPQFPNHYNSGMECHDRTETVRVVFGRYSCLWWSNTT